MSPPWYRCGKPSVWHASSLNKTLTVALYDEIKEALKLLLLGDKDN